MCVLRRFISVVVFTSIALMLSACDSAEERAEGHYQDALALIAEGDTDRAIVELRNVLSLDVSHRSARRTMAELQLERGNRQDAYRQYLYLAEQDPDDVETRIILSEMAFVGRNWDEVDRHGARLEELAPEDPRVQVVTLTRNYLAASRERDETTLRALGTQADGMLAAQPENALLRSVLIDHAMRQQDFTRALAEIDWVIANDPENSLPYQDRLRVLTQLGDMDGVEAQLEQMVELFADDPSHKTTLIRFYLSRNDLDAAEAFLRELAAASGPDETQPALDLIRFLVELRGPEAARAEIEKAIADRSDPVPFQTLAASLDFSEGRPDEAIAALEELLDGMEPSDQTRQTKMALARMLLATGNEVGARARIEEILAEDDTHGGALKMKAVWQIEADRTDEAISGLRIALDRDPNDAEAMTLLATAYARAGQAELGRDFLARAVEASGNAPAETLRFARVLIEEESYLPAEDILLAALRLDTANIDILVALGDLYLRMEDFGRAQGVADALRRIGDDAAIQAANGIEAERLNRQQGVEEALAFLESLANAEDATLATRIALVQARLGTGDAAGAIELAQELKRQNPDNDSLDIVLAVAHSSSGDFDVAASLYRGFLERNPMRSDVWLELSRLQQLQGDRDAAKASVQEGLVHSPEAANLLWAQASFLEQDGDVDGAIEIYERLYAQDSNAIVVANNLASLLTTYRDDAASLERAWAIARRLRDVEVPSLQDTYGWILHRRGNSEGALPYLEAAAAGLPKDPVVQYHLGQVYIALDRPDEGLEQLRRAVAIAGPADTRPQIETARALIQSLQSAAEEPASEETDEAPAAEPVEN